MARDALNRFVNGFLGHRNHQLFQFQIAGVWRSHFWQNFQLDRNFRVLAFFIAFTKVHSRLHRRAKRLFFHQSVDRIANSVVQRLRMELFAMHFLHEIRRNLARTKARHIHLRGNFRHLSLDLFSQLSSCDRDRIGPLEPLAGDFLDLHEN